MTAGSSRSRLVSKDLSLTLHGGTLKSLGPTNMQECPRMTGDLESRWPKQKQVHMCRCVLCSFLNVFTKAIAMTIKRRPQSTTRQRQKCVAARGSRRSRDQGHGHRHPRVIANRVPAPFSVPALARAAEVKTIRTTIVPEPVDVDVELGLGLLGRLVVVACQCKQDSWW